MDTRRLVNAALPRPLVWAQVVLYLWAVYGVAHGVVSGGFPAWEVFFGMLRALAAYGLANENRLGYWLALATAAVSVLPTLDEIVHRPALLVQPDVWVLLVAPVAVLVLLFDWSSRDHERAWYR